MDGIFTFLLAVKYGTNKAEADDGNALDLLSPYYKTIVKQKIMPKLLDHVVEIGVILPNHRYNVQAYYNKVKRPETLKTLGGQVINVKDCYKSNGSYIHYAGGFIEPKYWPEFTGLKINMMPFRWNDESSFPDFAKRYVPMIFKYFCGFGRHNYFGHDMKDGDICYLTIDESDLKAGETHRRGGLHTDAGPYQVQTHGSSETLFIDWGGGTDVEGGILLASNVSDSLAVYNCALEDYLIGKQGNCEHLRPYLDQLVSNGHMKKMCSSRAGTIYWISDVTPHESLPVKQDCKRQFIRIVGPKLGVWLEDHCTKNPLVNVPIQIVKGNKFENNLTLLLK